jgi:hypothetical protein
MAKQDEQKSNDANTAATKRFAQMTAAEKATHIGKVIVFFLSFGFAFPNIFSD